MSHITFSVQLIDSESYETFNYVQGVPLLSDAMEIFTNKRKHAITQAEGVYKLKEVEFFPSIWRVVDSNGNEIERQNLLTPAFTKGGYGKKAPYSTTHTRIPVAIKFHVESLANGYKQAVANDAEQAFLDDLNNPKCNDGLAEGLEHKVNYLVSENNELKLERVGFIEHIQQLQNEIELNAKENLNRVEALESVRDGFIEHIQHLQNESDRLNSDVSNGMIEYLRLHEENKRLQDEIDNVRSHSVSLVSEISGEHISQLQKEIGTLKHIVNKYKTNSKNTRNWVECNRMIEELFQACNEV